MKINLDRLCLLAGVDQAPSSLHEGKKSHAHGDDHAYEMNDPFSEEKDPVDEMEETLEELEKMEEMIEIDEVMLVQELRRAKRLMQESKQSQQSEETLQESELKSIIESEIANVMKELNLNSGWVYGGNKPKNSRAGYTHQGSFLKGLGFK